MYDIQALKLDIEFRDDKIAGSGLETGSDTETGGCGDPGLQRKLKLDLDTRVRDQVREGGAALSRYGALVCSVVSDLRYYSPNELFFQTFGSMR